MELECNKNTINKKEIGAIFMPNFHSLSDHISNRNNNNHPIDFFISSDCDDSQFCTSSITDSSTIITTSSSPSNSLSVTSIGFTNGEIGARQIGQLQ